MVPVAHNRDESIPQPTDPVVAAAVSTAMAETDGRPANRSTWDAIIITLICILTAISVTAGVFVVVDTVKLSNYTHCQAGINTLSRQLADSDRRAVATLNNATTALNAANNELFTSLLANPDLTSAGVHMAYLNYEKAYQVYQTAESTYTTETDNSNTIRQSNQLNTGKC